MCNYRKNHGKEAYTLVKSIYLKCSEEIPDIISTIPSSSNHADARKEPSVESFKLQEILNNTAKTSFILGLA